MEVQNRSHYKVMIVDDNEKNVALLQQQLEQAGYKTIVCYSGLEAIDKVKKEIPDVVVLDLMMPHLDGFQTCGILKKTLVSKFLPVIFLTVRGETESKIEALVKGGDDYITKPYDFQELDMKIQNMLRLIEVDSERRNLVSLQFKTQKITQELEILLESLKYSLKKIEKHATSDQKEDLHFAQENIEKILGKLK